MAAVFDRMALRVQLFVLTGTACKNRMDEVQPRPNIGKTNGQQRKTNGVA
jgi:hypothetical protein